MIPATGQPKVSPLEQHAEYLTVGDAVLYVQRIRHADGAPRPVLVFLHEALGSVDLWKGYPAALCTRSGFDAVVYDRRGHGKSSPLTAPRTLRFYREEAGEVLPALLAALGVTMPVLVGHSDGATIALKYASLFPEETRAVVSMAAHVVIEQRTVDGIRDAKRAYTESDLADKLRRYHGDKTDALFSAWADSWLDPSCMEWNMLDDLSAVTCPVLALQGDADAYGTERQVQLITRHCGGQVTPSIIPDCGHVPHHEARDRTLTATTNFLHTLGTSQE